MISTRQVGDLQLVSLSLATAERTLEQIGAVFPQVTSSDMAAAVSPHKTIVWSFTMPLVKMRSANVLVDTGFSFADDTKAASTSGLLAEAGLSADDISIVVLTHGHGDHVGGLLHEGSPAFTRAELVLHRAEYDFWTGAAAIEHYGEGAAVLARDAIAAYEDRLRLVEADSIVVEDDTGCLTARHIPGHTPGHLGMEISSGGERIHLLTDTLHTEVQLAHVDWSPRFDVDAGRAARERAAWLERVSRGHEVVHFYHLPFPGIGRVLPDGGAYRWDPVVQ